MALLPSDPQKQKLILVGLLPVLLAFGYYQFYHSNRVLEVAELQENVDRLEISNSGMRTIVARYGPDLERRVVVYQQHVRMLEDLIPRREHVPELISQITSRAIELGVELAALNPSAEEAGDFYSKQSYELQLLGDYHSIGEYLTAIGSLPRVVKSSSLKLNTEKPATEPGQPPQLRAMFRIETYIVPDQTTFQTETAAAEANGNANG